MMVSIISYNFYNFIHQNNQVSILLNSFKYWSVFMRICPESGCLSPQDLTLKPTKAKSESFQNFNARRIPAWVGGRLDSQTGSSFSFPRFPLRSSGEREAAQE